MVIALLSCAPDPAPAPAATPAEQSEAAPDYDSDSSTDALVRLLREGRGRPV